MIDDIILTMDIDWAPDFVINWVAKCLIEKQIRTTWFVTHGSPAVTDLERHSNLFELGIHPNFLKNSTQGSTADEILEYCFRIAPQAVSMRTHGLFQSSPLLAQILETTPIKIDCSIFLPYHPNIQPIYYHSGKQHLIRIPYYWEDDYEMVCPNPTWSIDNTTVRTKGIKIYNFHPIHIYLNSVNPGQYNMVKSMIPDLTQVSKKHLDQYVFPGIGTQNMFMAIVDVLASTHTSKLIRNAADEWSLKDI